jgi:hypothetical protein
MRARHFQKPGTVPRNDDETADPGHELETEAGVADLTPTEVTDEHISLREGLIKQFEIRYQRNEVKWLKHPVKKPNASSE